MDFYVIKSDEFKYHVLLGLDAIKKFSLSQTTDLKVEQDNKRKYCFQIGLEHEDEIKTRVNKLIQQNKNAFAKNKFDVGEVKSVEASINLSESTYVTQRPYRCSYIDKKEIDEQVQQLLKADLIEESASPYAAPVTLVMKKEEGKRTRLCIDFRKLNRIVIPDSYPFPRIEDIISKTANCQYFSILDINSAFWSIPIKPEHRERLAFTTEENLFQWKVLPFGFRNSPQIFQRTLANVIRKNNLNHCAINYMDDIIVYSKNLEEHFQHIQLLVTAISNSGFKLKLEKCKFAQTEVKYLGHIVGRNFVKPLGDGLRAIKEFPKPRTKKNVRQFLGKVNYYHRFIPNCAVILNPLHNLLRKDINFVWSKECNDTFEHLKEILCAEPILQIFDHKKEIFIETDASKIGIAAIMKQRDSNDILMPVAYFSKKISTSQAKRDAIYVETLAIKEAISYWQHMLIGREFKIITDHKPLENLRIRSRPDTPLGQLIVFLSMFNFKIIYRKGSENQQADALSRNPVLEYFENEEIIRTANLITIEEILKDQKEKEIETLKIKNEKDRKRIIISESLGTEIIKRVHKEFGHIGIGTLMNMVKPVYHFENMYEKARIICESCNVCLQNKMRIRKPMGFMGKFGWPEKPYQLMSLDTIGGFAGNNSKKKYLHVLTDQFTKFAWISTSTTQNARDFIKLISKIDHNIEILMADRYTGINSNDFRDYLKSRNIEFIMTPKNHPASNGAVERLGQTLLNRIRCKFNEKKGTKPWSIIAIDCVDEYNHTTHSVTKFAPIYLLNGTKPRLCPIELNKSDIDNDRKLAVANIEKDFQRNKIRVDTHFKDRELRIGDMVMAEEGNKLNRNKLDIIRSGPYKVTEKISSLMYRIENGRLRDNGDCFHKSQLVIIQDNDSPWNGDVT